MQAYLPRPTRQTWKSTISAATGPCSITSTISATTGASISASSSTRPVSRKSPKAQMPTRPAPTRPITGSSQSAPQNLPPVRATMASTEVAASVSTCR